MAFNNSFAGNVPNFKNVAKFGKKEKDPFNIQDTELFKQSQKTATEQMAGEVPAWNEYSNISREAFQAAQSAQQKANREALIRQGFQPDSGKYLEEGIIKPAAEQQREATAFERDLLVDRAQLGMQQKQAGQQAAGNLLGYLQTEREGALNRQTQERLAMANLGLGYEQLAEQARQFNITDQNQVNQFAQLLQKDYDQMSIQEKQFADTIGLDREKFEQVKLQNQQELDLQNRQLAETARQFNISSDIDMTQFAQLLQKDYDQMSIQEQQFATQIGLDRDKFNEAKNQFTQNLALERQRLAQEKLLAEQRIGLDRERLEETARQYNMNYDQAETQFNQNLQFNYDSLNEEQRQFMESMGLDREKFKEASRQFDLSHTLAEKIQIKDLELREQEAAQALSIANDRLEFDQLALDANLSEAEKDRVWKAVQNEKQIQANATMQMMDQQLDMWKQQQVAKLTEAGWEHEEALQRADNIHQKTMQWREIETQREIERGRISLQEKQLLQQAYQHKDELDWAKTAKELDLSNEQAKRIWSTKERISAEAFAAQQATFEAQMAKEIASGTWVDAQGNTVSSVQAKQMMEQARQFDSQQKWMEEAAKQGHSSWDAMRAYEKAEKAQDQANKMNLMRVSNELAMNNIKADAVYNAAANLDGDEYYEFVNSLAVDLGMTYPETDPKTGVTTTKQGLPKNETKPGQEGYDIMSDIESGNLSITQLKGADNKGHGMHEQYNKLLSTVDDWKPELVYDSGGMFGREEWNLKGVPEKGRLVKYNGRIYQINSGVYRDDRREAVEVVDVLSGAKHKLKVEGGRSDSKLKLGGL